MADQASGGLLSPWLKVRRLKKIAPWVRGHVFDYGCGTGDLLDYCQPASYIGCDLDRHSLAAAKTKNPRYEFVHDFSMIQHSGKKFDTIVMAAVIEHVDNPTEVLGSLKELLLPQGQIVLTTPHPNWRKVHDFGANLGFFSKEASKEHKSFLDYKVIVSISSQLGLTVLRSETFLFGANQIFVLGI
jgi:2-polyprenyl-3-methyl-5-hydroxy-6-metoxy-1,4-benzoquinol methylase